MPKDINKELDGRRAWVKNWVNDPEFKKRAMTALNNSAGQVDLSKISSKLHDNYWPDTSEDYVDDMVGFANKSLDRTKTKVVDQFAENPGQRGSAEFYEGMPGGEVTIARPHVFGSTPTHEYAHQSRVDQKIPELHQYKQPTFDEYNESDKDYLRYITSPDEVYANLMALRYDEGIEPGQTFTLDEVKGLQAKHAGNESFQFLSHLSAEDILDMLNKWAAIGSNNYNKLG